jgi:predicted phage terminase large subunit-like protein
VQANPDGYLDLWAREHYKDLWDGTPILTANRGWTTHGELRVGDRVFAPNGSAVPVVALSPRFTDSRCLRVTFSDGEQITCGSGHLWRTRRKIRRRVKGTDARRIEWREEVVRADALEIGADVGVAEALDGEPQQLPLDPYLLGAWLGDGTTGGASITAGFDDWEEMAALLRSRGVAVEAKIRPGAMRLRLGTGKRGDRRSSDFANALRSAGVYHDKHIPTIYQRASIHQRLMLLRGLMDTDGHCGTRGGAVFVSARERLARDTYELALGLGLRPRIAKYRNAWHIDFQAHKDRNPFLLERKASRAIEPTPYRASRWVRKIEEVGSVPTRCIQVEGGLYLAGRKLVPTHNSTIITFAQTIRDILNDPEITVGIFSHTRPIAKAFLRQIKQEFERNEQLKRLFPDILYADPQNQSPKWSEDEGITVKRKGNPKEATVEAYGVVDGQPTSRHYKLQVFDDIVTRESVGTPEMIAKTTEALALSYNLGSQGGRRRFIGTRYHFNDSYREVLSRGTAEPRIYAATEDGTVDGPPRFLSREALAKKRRDMGPYVYGCQMLQDPTADELQNFKEGWLEYASSPTWRGLNIVLVFDPASKKKPTSDYTSAWVLGLGADRNVYVVDMVRDRLRLTERADLLFQWHRKYQPMAVAYEEYGLQADVEHFEDRMERENYRFKITRVGGRLAKNDRIRRLIPWFEKGRIFLPPKLDKRNHEGKLVDLVQAFIQEEYIPFPVATHDDMLDGLSRFLEPDLEIRFPAAMQDNDDDDEEIYRAQDRSKVTGY